MRILVQVVVSIPLTFLLLMLWVSLANANGWSHFTGWGMAHGGILIALPVSSLASFGALFLVPWFRRGWSQRQ